MSELKNKKKSRAGHKGYLKRALEEVDDLKITARKKSRHSSHGGRRSKNNWKNSQHNSAELCENNKIKLEVTKRLAAINELLAHVQTPGSSPSASPATANPPQHQNSSVRARLPKVEVRKFGGNISAWEEFWDSFEGAIEKNETLADVDKFSYLRGLLVEPARSAIAGFALTSAKYKAAIDL